MVVTPQEVSVDYRGALAMPTPMPRKIRTEQEKCPKCEYGWIKGSYFGRQIYLSKEIFILDKGAVDYGKKLMSRKKCDYCFGTGFIKKPIRESIQLITEINKGEMGGR